MLRHKAIQFLEAKALINLGKNSLNIEQMNVVNTVKSNFKMSIIYFLDTVIEKVEAH